MLRSSYSLNLSLAHVHSAFSGEGSGNQTTSFKPKLSVPDFVSQLCLRLPNYSPVIIGKFLWTMEYAMYCSH